MSIVPVSPVSARQVSTANVLLAVGFSAVTIVGSSNGQLQDFGLRSSMSSSNLAPTSAQRVVPPPVVRPDGAPFLGRSKALLLAEAHEVSGLTWEQIARYFGVSRRAVHLWA